MKTEQRVPHQLMIHLDYHPNGALEIRYSYPLRACQKTNESSLGFAEFGEGRGFRLGGKARTVAR